MLCYGSYKYTKRCLVLRIYWEFRPSSVEPPANAFVLRGGAHGSVGLWVWGAGRITGAATHHLTTRLLKLGLGAKITPKMKVAVSSDPVVWKLLGKLNSKKKLSSDNREKASPVKENAPSDDDENEPESRTSAFAKKRLKPPATYLQSTKKRK
ncbi:hypothetical protein B296_00057067 [Ensete ventricosum]|uniref:Uncharacterized protein n=1 Tax=Ensete ventricosum TaxID=4639 RepID=A0A426XSN1_ENSVE|nr:hypothetical protein B296_00057067 [Ensete ventricosum]